MNLRANLRAIAFTTVACLLVACSGPSADEHFAHAERVPEPVAVAGSDHRVSQRDSDRPAARRHPPEARRHLRRPAQRQRSAARVRARGRPAAERHRRAGQGRQPAAARRRVRRRAKPREQRAVDRPGRTSTRWSSWPTPRPDLKDLDGALTEYQEAATLNPSDRVYAGMGTIQLARGEMADAEVSFRKAVDVAPESLDGAPRARQLPLVEPPAGRGREESSRPRSRSSRPTCSPIARLASSTSPPVARPRPSRTSRPLPPRSRPPRPPSRSPTTTC